MPLLATLLYRLSLSVYKIGASVLSLWNIKAAKWVEGQRHSKDVFKNLSLAGKNIWVHCASLGEYEQGQPVIDALQKQYPQYHLVLTFFSPSGYEIVKPKLKDITVLYLPLDSEHNAQLFLDTIKPSLAIFIKYEHWYYYLRALKDRGIPALSISSIFRNNQPFFKWYGGLFRRMLKLYSRILVQDQESVYLLKTIGIENAEIIGDTRFDRVYAVLENKEPLPIIEQFKTNSQLLIAGSTWPKDEQLLARFINDNHTALPDLKYIIAPHEINEAHIVKLASMLTVSVALYSQADNVEKCAVLIIDSIGILSRTYRYGNVAYIGGGFGAGIHNTLEAAVNGIPITFGPRYQKFKEAVEMKSMGAAFPINNYEEFEQTLLTLLNDTTNQAGKVAAEYVQQQTGATKKVMQVIKEILPPQ